MLPVLGLNPNSGRRKAVVRWLDPHKHTQVKHASFRGGPQREAQWGGGKGQERPLSLAHSCEMGSEYLSVPHSQLKSWQDSASTFLSALSGALSLGTAQFPGLGGGLKVWGGRKGGRKGGEDTAEKEEASAHSQEVKASEKFCPETR